MFVSCVLPGVTALLLIQDARYGSPFASGYATLNELYSLRNILPNLQRYPRWLTETHTPFIWLGLAAPIWIARREGEVARLAWTLYGFSVAVAAVYLPYVFFQPQEWFYTRFLLPAIPLMLLFGVIMAMAAARRLSPALRMTSVSAGLAVLLVGFYAISHERGVLALREAERKYPDAGAYVRNWLPASAYVLAKQHSGSIRYYAGRPTLRWDLLDGASLDRAIAGLRAGGYEPFAVVDEGEAVEFRERFESGKSGSTAGTIPIAAVGQTVVYAFR